MMHTILSTHFFDRPVCEVAKALLGKVIYVKYENCWLRAQIIETEAYALDDKASHGSLGFTEKRKALFMAPGTIYMYYARGGDSLNISCQGAGSAVLIKSGISLNHGQSLAQMHQLNPCRDRRRGRDYLCSGQTLLCRSLHLKVPIWDQQSFDPHRFYIADLGYQPHLIIQTTRLGIPKGRDEELPYRFIDHAYFRFCTKRSGLDAMELLLYSPV